MSAPSLALELHRRNALLRAWRAYGVPVEGAWERKEAPNPLAELWRLEVACSDCGQSLPGTQISSSGLCTPEEQKASVIRFACPHLSPLLAPSPPPEVMAIAELELFSMG